MAKRAGQAHGWQTGEFLLYGQSVSTTYQTFLATWPPVGGVIQVALVWADDGWQSFFCTAADATVAQILEACADRAAIELDFHDLKEVHGAGEQQVRHYWSNLAVYHLILWLHTLIELWAWSQSHRQLCDRGPSPWDDAKRRPSHADRRNALRRQSIETAMQRVQGRCPRAPKFRALVRRLLRLVAC